MPLALAPADLAEVVRQAVREAAPHLERDERELAESYPDQPLPVLIDAGKLRRVVDNLLDNAVGYSPPAGRLRVTAECREGEALVSVSDEGPGIPPELHQHIFQKFGQADGTGPPRRMSVGLGLTFARLAVEAHGGRIWVESAPGQGSTFTFALPLTAGKTG
jgi:signal transduction histidine kinase